MFMPKAMSGLLTLSLRKIFIKWIIVRAYDLDGKLVWWFKGMSSITIATPYADGGQLYVTSGYVGDRSRPIYAVKPGATGDITVTEACPIAMTPPLVD